MGTSGPSSSTLTLSTPMPISALSRCSTVPTLTPSRPSVVASEVSTTKSPRAGSSGFPGRSVLTNTTPWSTGAGTSAIVTTLLPKGPALTEVRSDFLFHPDTIEASGFDPTPIVEFSDLVTAQDNMVCESVQQGITSVSFDHGVLTPKDDYVIEFVARYRRHMADPDR